jgi:polyphosphate glucokinase
MRFAISPEALSREQSVPQPTVIPLPQRRFDSARRVLTIDIGGSNVKVLVSGETEPRRRRSGKTLTPSRLVPMVQELADGWDYDAVSIGYPGLVGRDGPSSEPGNLGPGWVGFDFRAAFGKPVRIINDAAMQALGSYEGGTMLYLGLGSGLGSALISDGEVIPLELGCLRYDADRTLGDVLGNVGLTHLGKRAWRRIVADVAAAMMKAFVVQSVVLGGGNAKKLKANLPHGMRLGHNLTAFRGGFWLWTGAPDASDVRRHR